MDFYLFIYFAAHAIMCTSECPGNTVVEQLVNNVSKNYAFVLLSL